MSVKDINTIWPLSHTLKILQRLLWLQRDDILSEVLGQYLWGNPVAMRQIVFSRHLTWIAALPPYRSGPPCPLYSHIYPLVSTSDSRGGVHLNSSCRCERRGNLGPLCETKQLHFILNWELGTWVNSPLSSSSCILETWKGKEEVSNAWTVSIYWSRL